MTDDTVELTDKEGNKWLFSRSMSSVIGPIKQDGVGMQLPEGWVAVPTAITAQMSDALNQMAQCEGYIEKGYEDMLKAAPKLVLYGSTEAERPAKMPSLMDYAISLSEETRAAYLEECRAVVDYYKRRSAPEESK